MDELPPLEDGMFHRGRCKLAESDALMALVQHRDVLHNMPHMNVHCTPHTMQRATCSMQRATCSVQHAACNATDVRSGPGGADGRCARRFRSAPLGSATHSGPFRTQRCRGRAIPPLGAMQCSAVQCSAHTEVAQLADAPEARVRFAARRLERRAQLLERDRALRWPSAEHSARLATPPHRRAGKGSRRDP